MSWHSNIVVVFVAMAEEMVISYKGQLQKLARAEGGFKEHKHYSISDKLHSSR